MNGGVKKDQHRPSDLRLRLDSLCLWTLSFTIVGFFSPTTRQAQMISEGPLTNGRL